MSITDQVQQDMTAAMKARDREKASALRMILSQLRMGKKDARGEFGEQEELAVLALEKKRRLQAAEAFRDGGREDRAEMEEAEAAIIEQYMPKALSGDELQSIVDEAIEAEGASGMANMGAVMSRVMSMAQGRADGKLASELVRKALSG